MNSLKLKICQNIVGWGSTPCCGSLMMFPRPSSQLERGHPSQPHPAQCLWRLELGASDTLNTWLWQLWSLESISLSHFDNLAWLSWSLSLWRVSWCIEKHCIAITTDWDDTSFHVHSFCSCGCGSEDDAGSSCICSRPLHTLHVTPWHDPYYKRVC